MPKSTRIALLFFTFTFIMLLHPDRLLALDPEHAEWKKDGFVVCFCTRADTDPVTVCTDNLAEIITHIRSVADNLVTFDRCPDTGLPPTVTPTPTPSVSPTGQPPPQVPEFSTLTGLLTLCVSAGSLLVGRRRRPR